MSRSVSTASLSHMHVPDDARSIQIRLVDLPQFLTE